MAEPTLKSALDFVKSSSWATEEDREHLRRWIAEANDPVWEQVAANIRKRGELYPFSSLIRSALVVRRSAERMSQGPHVERKQRQEREQQERTNLLVLADKMDEVVQLYQQLNRYRVLTTAQKLGLPGSSEARPDPKVLEVKRSLKWLEDEAQSLRQRAEKEPGDEPDWPWDQDHIRVKVSRQSGGKHKRAQSRQLGVFMQKMVNFMWEACGKPNYGVVAVITNIAFPDADVGAEEVRSICRPRTRAGRRRRTGAPKRIKPVK